jgi:hypothetical protein
VLEGNLDDFTLTDILRLLASTGKSGRLALRREDAVGRVDLTDGRVREASGDADHLVIARRLLGAGLVTGDQLVGALRARDALPTDLELARDLADAGLVDPGAVAAVVREHTVDAVFDLLRWREGLFRFDSGSHDGEAAAVLELAVPVDELLTEAADRLASWPAVEERTGDGSAVVTISQPPGPQGQVSLSPDGWALLSFVDGRRTVADLAHLAGQGEFRTRRTLISLLDAGVVTIADSGGPGHVERLLADHDRLAALEAELGGAAATSPPAPHATRATGRSEPEAPAPRPAPAGTSAAAPGAPAEGTAAQLLAVAGPPREDRPAPPPTASPPAPDTEPRTRGPNGHRDTRVQTDPTVDADLVRRLIDGVGSL